MSNKSDLFIRFVSDNLMNSFVTYTGKSVQEDKFENQIVLLDGFLPKIKIVLLDGFSSEVKKVCLLRCNYVGKAN